MPETKRMRVAVGRSVNITRHWNYGYMLGIYRLHCCGCELFDEHITSLERLLLIELPTEGFGLLSCAENNWVS